VVASSGRSGVWWRAFRFHYTTASTMPGFLGAAIAWTTDRTFHGGYFLLVMAGLLLNHFALNMTDDYYDFRHLVDVFAGGEGNPYTGGSGTLSAGLIAPGEMRRVFSAFYMIAIGIGVYLGFVRGGLVHLLLALGFFCAFFYTAPPVRFGYRGFGELAQLLCFGPGIGLGAYYVQAQRVSWEAFWGTLPFGFLLFAMITINEIPDFEEDRRGGKLNLVARFGKRAGVRLFTAALAAAYGTIVTGVLLGRIPGLGLISLATVPIALRTVKILRAHYDDPLRMAPANLGMICIHNFTAILLMAAYLVSGFRGEAFGPSVFPFLLMILLYIPVAKLILSALLAARASSPGRECTT
jgi:1,4-dihydroxy-2-naphthoate octaprenyltransferase